MSSRVLAIAAICAVAAIGAAFVFLPRRAPVPAEAPATDAPAASPAPAAGGAAAPEASAAPAAPRPRAARPEAVPVPAEAAPAVVEAPDAGTLRIESDVPGAQVFIDRQFIGTTPVTAANLKPGTHQLNVSAEGFDGVARPIDVEAGSRDLM
ncbi:MAG TPA: PEGA domain-containing protein, partial [Vicinamibacterales bacterium]|nr:PEGA domain-containing protein [Vicinamibacterales bacterium]